MRKIIHLLLSTLFIVSFVSPSTVEAETIEQKVAMEDKLSAGGNHSCALIAAGLVRCWGAKASGQLNVPSDLGVVTQVSVGAEHSCALTAAGLVRCWGTNDHGQLDVPLGVVTHISAGREHSCALTAAGLVRCWGANGSGQLDVPSDLGVVTQVSAGAEHSCALTAAGLVRCWGANDDGQLDVPPVLGVVTQISGDWWHSCALTAAGLVRCWGANGSGRLNVPSDLGVVTQVSVGAEHSCALTAAGLVRCWGANRSGQLDVPSDLGVVTQVSAGAEHSCALTAAGLVRCWGANDDGQLDVPQGGVFMQPHILNVGIIEGAIAGESTLASTLHAKFDLVAGRIFNYVWFRDGIKIRQASQSTYQITEEDIGSSLTVELISRDGGNIYFGVASKTVDYPPLEFAEPNLLGINSVGSTLIASLDRSDQEVSYSYQWLRNGQEIPGANSYKYSIGLADLGRDLSVRVTGSKDRYRAASRTSKPSTILSVIPNTPCLGDIDTALSWVGNASQPSITGVPEFGQTFRGLNGVWASGTKFCVFWIADGVVVPQAKTSTYKLLGSEVDKKVQYVVVGIDKSFKRLARISEPLIVRKATFTNVKAPVVKGFSRVGAKLTSSLTSWGTGTSYTYQWLRDSKEIYGAIGSSYIPTAQDTNTNLSLRVCGSKQYYEPRCVESVQQIVNPGMISKVGQVSIGGASTNIGATLIGNTTQWMQGVELSWQWLSDGIEIEGATGSSFTISRADRGRSISLRVTGSAQGYITVSKMSKAKKIP